MISEDTMPYLSSAKLRPITGLTRKPQWQNKWCEPPESRQENEQVLHCVQTYPPPIQGQSDVSFRGFGTILVSMSIPMQWICYEETLLNWSRAYHSIQLRFVFESSVKSHSYNKLLGFKYLRTASKCSLLSVFSVLGHGAFCCIKSAGQTLIVFFYSWCRVE